ncbi:hypothetical protein BH18THE1_BH18THE1_03380 [soil metagenome]
MASDEERRIEILQFVKKRQQANQRTTKAIVIRHMKEKRLGSAETTHNTMKELRDEGKLYVKKIHSQLHFLTINEENEFNKTYEMLTQLEAFMNIMHEIVDRNKINLDKHSQIYGVGKEFNEYLGAVELYDYLLAPYRNLFETILQIMLIRIIRLKITPKDTVILSARIIDLLNKLTHTFVYGSPPNINSMLESKIDSITSSLENTKYLQNYAKENDINLNIIDDLVAMVRKFRKFNT